MMLGMDHTRPGARRRRRTARFTAGAVALVLALGVLLTTTASTASAHAQLVSTDPVAGAALPEAPERVTVTFNARVNALPDAVRVFDGDGSRVDTGDLDIAEGGEALRLELPDLPDGGYVVTWRVVSVDGHPITGGVSWRVGDGPAVERSVLARLLSAEGGDAGLHALAAVVRTLMFGALVVLVGGLFFVALLWPAGATDRRTRRALVGAAIVGFVATAVSMGVEAADAAGRGIGRVADVGAAVDTWDTSFGKGAIARLVLLVALGALAATMHRRTRRGLVWDATLVGLALATFATLSVSGHARTGRWTTLAVPLDVVHQLAGSIWLGGLAVLAVLVIPRLVGDDGTVERFSRLAMVSVIVVAATGLLQGVRQLRDVDGVRDTDYGRILVIKVVLVALVVVLGAMSRSIVRARRAAKLEAGADLDEELVVLRRRLRRSVALETVVAIGVLVATSLLVAADPTAADAPTGFTASKVVDGAVVDVTAAPTQPGPVTFHITASDPGAGLTTEVTATATLSLSERGITGVAVPLHRIARGHWTATAVDVPIAGDWTLRVTVVTGLDSRMATFVVPVR
jgi:copper transport protein